ncbi:unnamed protein product [Symbiodinium natans]|uniref:Ubiquitin-like domain-containing protein n=1 Tax=Symbiodinium natans TaxID=878477 RepID=A0A812NAU6_9DINO|nr:unnamed protein product [Symbiodinium natans]
MLACRIRSLSGQSFDLEVPPESTVKDVKYRIEQDWAIPKICQKLLYRDQLLTEKCRCQSFADGCVELQLVITTEILRSSLSSALALEALQSLHSIAKDSGGDPKVWSAVEAEVWDSLNQPLRDVQDSATSVLMAAAVAGRSNTREEVLERLESRDERSRLVAVQMLGIMRDASADALRRRLLDPSDSVRSAAAEALAARPEFLDQAARFALSALLHDRSALVRTAAARALARFVSISGCPFCVHPGESEKYADNVEFAFLAVLARLQHPDPSVRSSVAGAAGAVLSAAARRRCERCGARRRPEAAEETSFAAMAAQTLSACLADSCAAVRALALQALAELSGGKDGKIMAAELSALKNQVAPCLKHMDAGVRVAATRATVRLVQNGDRESIQVLQRLVHKDSDISVRTAAKNALLALGVDPF